MSLAYLGADFNSTAFSLRKAKLIFDLGKHTLNLATTQKEVQSAGDILSRAKQQLDQAWDSFKETAREAARSGDADNFSESLFKQLEDLSLDVAAENTRYFSKMTSMDGFGDWRKTLASKVAAAASRRASYEKGFPERSIRWTREIRESIAKSQAAREQPNIPLLPEEDRIKSFRESIQRALDSARHGEDRAASAYLERALIQSKTFQNPEFTNTVLDMTRWFIDKRSQKSLIEKVRSIRSDVSNAMTSIMNDDPDTAVDYSNRAERLLQTIPTSFSGPLKRLVATAQRLSRNAIKEAQDESLVQSANELQLKWRGLLPQEKLTKLKARLKSGLKLPPHGKLPKIKGIFQVQEMLQRVERNLEKAESLLPADDFRAAEIIRRSQDQLQLAIKQAPRWEWEASFPEGASMVQRQMAEKAAHANFEKFIGQIRNLANRIFDLSMKSKTLRSTIENPEESL